MKLKLWLNIATFVAMAVILIFGWHDIVAALKAMARLNIWVLLLIIPVQFFAFFAVAKVYQEYFKATGFAISAKTLFATSIELNFVNHIFPSGGVSGFSYLTFRLKKEGVSTAKSTLAQLVRYAFVLGTFILLLIFAVFMLALEDKASRLIIFIATAIVFSIAFAAIATVYIVGSEQRIQTFTNALTRFLNKIINIFRRKHPETIKLSRVKRTFQELHKDYGEYRHHSRKMGKAIAWSLVANIAEVALVYIAFVAHGEWVNPGAIIIAYAVATFAGLLAILPGGIGVYEPLMVGVLLSAGVPSGVAVSATLVSRVMTLLIALVSGYFLYHRALRHHGKSNS